MIECMDALLDKARRNFYAPKYWEMNEGTFANLVLEAGGGMLSEGAGFHGLPIEFTNSMENDEVYLWCEDGVIVHWGKSFDDYDRAANVNE